MRQEGLQVNAQNKRDEAKEIMRLAGTLTVEGTVRVVPEIYGWPPSDYQDVSSYFFSVQCGTRRRYKIEFCLKHVSR